MECGLSRTGAAGIRLNRGHPVACRRMNRVRRRVNTAVLPDVLRHACQRRRHFPESLMSSALRPLLLAAGFAVVSTCMVYTSDAEARVVVDVGIGVPPPLPRPLPPPPPRAGYAWAPGFWRWDAPRHRHVWVDGHWERVRAGYAYRPAHWVQRGPDWRFVPGHWARR
jgi:hypothetical protein